MIAASIRVEAIGEQRIQRIGCLAGGLELGLDAIGRFARGPKLGLQTWSARAQWILTERHTAALIYSEFSGQDHSKSL